MHAQTAVDQAAPNTVAIWLHPTDAARSLVFGATENAGVELYDPEARRLSLASTHALDYVDVAYDVLVGGRRVDLIVGHERGTGMLALLALDSNALALRDVALEPVPLNAEVTGLCTYRSPITGALHVFVVTGEGLIQQWALYGHQGHVAGTLVRMLPIGAGAAYCAVDAEDRAVYVGEESVGIWKLHAEPESDAERTLVDIVGARGHLTEEVKGLATYRAGDTAYLLAADVAAGRINVYTPHNTRYVGSFALAGKGLHGLTEVEGLAAISAPLGRALAHGMVVIADQDAGYRYVAWDDIARALRLPGGNAASPRRRARSIVPTVMPTVETAPVDDYGDAADDPAIWVHPTDPSQSIIIGAQKKRGLYVYDLAGKTLQVVADGRMNNVDLRHGFQLGNSVVALVAASNRTDKSLAIYKVNPTTRRLERATRTALPTGLRDPYGLCMYRSKKSGKTYVFVNDSDGGVYRQWELVPDGDQVGAALVREFTVGSQAEGCAADDETGALYIAEEDVGLWRYLAEPDGADHRVQIDTTARGHLRADVEGIAIYYGAGTAGYLIVSNQGNDNYAVYRRDGDNAFVGHFAVAANPPLGIDGASETDGLDVISAPLGAAFPHGLFIAQDGRNIAPAERQNFKLVPWERIATALALQTSNDKQPHRLAE